MPIDPELLVENRNKYGRDAFDDIDELAAGLDGRELGSGSVSRPRLVVPVTNEIDEDFIRTLGNPRNHYGSFE